VLSEPSGPAPSLFKGFLTTNREIKSLASANFGESKIGSNVNSTFTILSSISKEVEFPNKYFPESAS